MLHQSTTDDDSVNKRAQQLGGNLVQRCEDLLADQDVEIRESEDEGIVPRWTFRLLLREVLRRTFQSGVHSSKPGSDSPTQNK